MRHYLSVKGPAIPEYRAHLIIVQTQKFPLNVDFPDYVQLVECKFGHIPTLSLEYLHNYQLGSPNGVRGWIGWSGRVGCELLELPAIEPFDMYTVSADWKTIAQAYSFLNLQAQVYNHDAAKLLGQWDVENGRVKYHAPEKAAHWKPSEPLSVKRHRRSLEAATIPLENFQLGASEKRLDLAAANITSVLRT